MTNRLNGNWRFSQKPTFHGTAKSIVHRTISPHWEAVDYQRSSCPIVLNRSGGRSTTASSNQFCEPNRVGFRLTSVDACIPNSTLPEFVENML